VRGCDEGRKRGDDAKACRPRRCSKPQQGRTKTQAGAIGSVKHMACWLRDGLIIVIAEMGIK